MKSFLEYLIKALVDKPEEVVVEENEENGGIVFLNVRVAKEDMGKIIGKEGRVIKAIRDLVRICAVKNQKKVNVSLLDESSEA